MTMGMLTSDRFVFKHLYFLGAGSCMHSQLSVPQPSNLVMHCSGCFIGQILPNHDEKSNPYTDHLSRICWFSGSSDRGKDVLENLKSGVFVCKAYQRFAISMHTERQRDQLRFSRSVQKSQGGVLLDYHLTLLEDLIYVKNTGAASAGQMQGSLLRSMLVDSCGRLSSTETSSWEPSKQQPKFACSLGA